MDKKLISKPAAFLDRDGVLVRDTGYVYRIEDLHILPGAPEALQLLKDHGFLLIVISNQAGVARGYYSTEDVATFHTEMQKKLGVPLDGIYFCPHHPDGSVFEYAIRCNCRKPGTALLEKAAQDFAIDWEHSVMVGDRASDIECGLKAGIVGIQIESDQYEGHENPHVRVRDLLEAAQWTVKNRAP